MLEVIVLMWVDDFCPVVGRKVGWLKGGPPPATLSWEKNHTGMAPPKKRQPLVSHGLHCRACIDRQLESRWTFTSGRLDVFVRQLLIPTRRGVGG